MRLLKLAQCVPHLLQQALLLRFCDLRHHTSDQPACCRLQENIERSVMGLKWKSTGDDFIKASFSILCQKQNARQTSFLKDMSCQFFPFLMITLFCAGCVGRLFL